jgi:hypothetical protein
MAFGKTHELDEQYCPDIFAGEMLKLDEWAARPD